MFRFTVRDGLWLTVLIVIVGAWMWDRLNLALNLKNCRFVLEQQRQTINELSDQTAAPDSKEPQK